MEGEIQMTRPERIAEIEALLSKATPGPWYVYERGSDNWTHVFQDANPCDDLHISVYHGVPETQEANATLCADAPSALRFLLDELKRAQEFIDVSLKFNDCMDNHGDEEIYNEAKAAYDRETP
jgi:hypothetical protein